MRIKGRLLKTGKYIKFKSKTIFGNRHFRLAHVCHALPSPQVFIEIKNSPLTKNRNRNCFSCREVFPQRRDFYYLGSRSTWESDVIKITSKQDHLNNAYKRTRVKNSVIIP